MTTRTSLLRRLEYDPAKEQQFQNFITICREHQSEKWGVAHDETLSWGDWGLVLLRYAGRVGESLERVGLGIKVISELPDEFQHTAAHVRAVANDRVLLGDDLVVLASLCQACFTIWDARFVEGLSLVPEEGTDGR